MSTGTPSLKYRLVKYLLKVGDWVPGIELQRLTLEKAHQTGKTASRRLQEAVNEGSLEVRLVRGAAQYRAKKSDNPHVLGSDAWAEFEYKRL